jgi:hypothetical protein
MLIFSKRTNQSLLELSKIGMSLKNEPRRRCMIKKGIKVFVIGLLGLMLVSCTTTSIKDETLKADILSYLEDYSDVKEVSSLTVKSQKSVDGEQVVETSFDFSNTDADFSAEMTLTYDKVGDEWEVVNHAFNLLSTNTIHDIDTNSTSIINFITRNQLTFFYERSLNILQPEYLSLDSATKNSPNSTTLVYKYSINKLNWSYNEILTIQADYSYPTGWHYTLKEWVYTETSDWAGTWQINLFNPNGTIAQTINDLVITGNLSVSRDSGGELVEENTLWAKFTYEGQPISTEAYLLNRSTNVCGILLMFGNNISERSIEIGINLVSESNTGLDSYEYYVSSFEYQEGNILIIK